MEHVEDMPCSSVIFLSIHRVLIKGHKELYEALCFSDLLSDSATDHHV